MSHLLAQFQTKVKKMKRQTSYHPMWKRKRMRMRKFPHLMKKKRRTRISHHLMRLKKVPAIAMAIFKT